jgi:uncharacterized protein
MRREEALRILAEHKNELTGFGVKSLSLFGSVARDDAGPHSDVDVLVEFDRPVGIFEFLDVQEYLEEILGRRVDLATPDSLHPRLRDRILANEPLPRREWKFRIEDVLDCIASVQEYTRGMDFERFGSDHLTADAVARRLDLIGGAVQGVPAEVRARHPEVPWEELCRTRADLLRGRYHVEPRVLWDSVHEGLPPLVPPLREILEAEP